MDMNCKRAYLACGPCYSALQVKERLLGMLGSADRLVSLDGAGQQRKGKKTRAACNTEIVVGDLWEEIKVADEVADEGLEKTNTATWTDIMFTRDGENVV